jgi:replicative DNA helicase
MEEEFKPEREVIGGLLIKPENFESVRSQLSAEDFFSLQCRNIFLAMEDLYQDNTPIDMTTILSRLKNEEDRKLSRYLESEIPTDQTLPYWVRRAKEDSLKRQIIAEANKQGEMSGEKIEKLSYQLNSLKHPAPTCQFFEDIPSLEEDPSPIIKTGFKALDRYFPFRAPRMMIVGGATGEGKTSFLLQCAHHITQERVAGIISIERMAQEIKFRFTNSFGVAPPPKRFIIEAPGAISTLKMKHILKTMKSKGAGLVMVDFLQLMRETDRFATRHLEVSHIIRCLKDFAKELRLPMIVVSTIARGQEGVRPTLSSLKESGDLEYAADLVVFIHQPKKGEENYFGEKVKLFILAKNLWGRCGDIPVVWDPEKTRFSDYHEETAAERQQSFMETTEDRQPTY